MVDEPEQELLFETPPDWRAHWASMPSYEHIDIEPKRDLIVHFRNDDDLQKFAKLVGQKITDKTKYLWYPKQKTIPTNYLHFKSSKTNHPSYPVYVISKGRWETRLTSIALEELDVAYKIVVEPQEYDQYAKVIDPKKILTLPFSNLGEGSIPARNWVWSHAISTGAARHWILDDNIRGFYRFQNNLKLRVGDGTTFKIIEDHVDRYENVGLAGMQYYMFVVRKEADRPPFYLNTRIYSCILVKNDLPHRWRGRYNEDTDLSLRVLKDGWCTLLYNAFIIDKMTTLTMKGGNMEELYKGDGRLKMAESLREQHPDVVKITKKWGRDQHQVNYADFKRNKLRLKDGIKPLEECDDYGMSLQILNEIEAIGG